MSHAAHRSRHREQREHTRGQILEAADRFLREHPYREMSIDLVMAPTGLTRTAFYRHFDDPSELVLRLLEDVGQEVLAVAQRWGASAGDDYEGAAHEGLVGIVDFFVRNGPLVRAVSDAATTDEQIDRGYRGFMETFTELIRRSLDEFVARGRIEVPDTRALALALNLMNEAYLLEEFGREPFGDREVVLATLETVWLRVVGARPRETAEDRGHGHPG